MGNLPHICCIVIVHTVAVLLLQGTGLVAEETGCDFKKHKVNKEELASFNHLKPLFGKRYTVTDPDRKYTYHVGVCTKAMPDQVGSDGVGAIQVETIEGKPATYRKLGSYKDADIIAGTDWVYLEYMNGDNYNSHCGKESRRVVIMLTCDLSKDDSNAHMILLEENTNKSTDCYYLFELSHKDLCPIKDNSALSLGSIFVIVLISLVGVYVLCGFLYQRFVLGAKGMEQIPNYSFWQDFGNLQADGCDFLCRTQGRSGPRTYKGVGDDQLEDTEERDDHLLPM